MFRTRVLVMVFLGLLLGACRVAPGGEMPAPVALSPATTPTPTPTAIAMPTPTPTGEEPVRSPAQVDIPMISPELQPYVNQAVADLSQRLAIPPDAITVVSADAVVWPDAAMGCPEPGMGYAQVLTEGLQVVLEVDGQTYAYHGSPPEPLFLCGPDGPVPPGQLPAESGTRRAASGALDQAQAIVETVKADMAERLGVPVDSIEVVAVTPQQWRTSGLGCEQPGQMYLQVITPGLQVVLAAEDVVYTYHTDLQGNFVLCSQGMG